MQHLSNGSPLVAVPVTGLPPIRRWLDVVSVVVDCIAVLKFSVGGAVGTSVDFAIDAEDADKVAGDIRVAFAAGRHMISK